MSVLPVKRLSKITYQFQIEKHLLIFFRLIKYTFHLFVQSNDMEINDMETNLQRNDESSEESKAT